MKNFKSIVLLVALFAMNNVSAVPLNGANYQRFSTQYKGYLITPNNSVDMAWIQGVVGALRADGLYNEKNFEYILWPEIEPMVNYYAKLPQNSNNPAFKEQVRTSLKRGLEQVLRSSTQQQWQVARPLPQASQVRTTTIAEPRALQAAQGQAAIGKQMTPYVPQAYVPQTYVPQTYVPQVKPLSNFDKLMLEQKKAEVAKLSQQAAPYVPQAYVPQVYVPQAKPLSNFDKLMLEQKKPQAAKLSQQTPPVGPSIKQSPSDRLASTLMKEETPERQQQIKSSLSSPMMSRASADKMQYIKNLGQLKKYKEVKDAGPSTVIFKFGEMTDLWLKDVFAILSKDILLTQDMISTIERVMQDAAVAVVAKVIKPDRNWNAKQIGAAQDKVRSQVSRFIKKQNLTIAQ
jgi:hypothetical protein